MCHTVYDESRRRSNHDWSLTSLPRLPAGRRRADAVGGKLYLLVGGWDRLLVPQLPARRRPLQWQWV